MCVFVWSILHWSWDRTVVFYRHSPILSRLSPLRRYQSLVKVDEIVPLWCNQKNPSIFILSFFLKVWHDHKRSCFSHHSSMSSSSEIPSSVMSWRSLPFRGTFPLHHLVLLLVWRTWFTFFRCWRHRVTRRVLLIQLNTRFLLMIQESRITSHFSTRYL
jgi:hypothetical protein